MRVVLANPPWIVDGRIGVRAGSRWPHLKTKEEGNYLPYPFFLGYSSSLLKKHGFDVLFIDAIAEGISVERFINKVVKFKPDFVLIEVSTPSLEYDLKILKKLRERTKAAIAISGMDYSIRKPAFLKEYPFVDFVLYGEYEFTLLEVVEHLKNNRSLHDVKGLIYREKHTNRIVINPPRPLININELPWPDRESVPIYKYLDAPGAMPLPCAQMMASRGCPFKCIFCAWPQVMYNGSNYRVRKIKDVVDEMEFLVKKLGFKSIYFDDDTFNIGKERMLEFANEVKKRKLKVPFAIMARADLMDYEILKALREAGLYAIKYGVESADQKLLDNAHKNMDIKKVESIIKLTKKLGIKVHLTFTFGLPGETKETIEKTIRFALQMDPFTLQFSITTPFPGTEYYKELEKQGQLVFSRMSDFDGNFKAVIKTPELNPEDLEIAVREAYRRWEEHLIRKRRIRSENPVKLFRECLREHGWSYTLKHTKEYILKRIGKNQSSNVATNDVPNLLKINIYILPKIRLSQAPLTPYLLKTILQDKLKGEKHSLSSNTKIRIIDLNRCDSIEEVLEAIIENEKSTVKLDRKGKRILVFYVTRENLESSIMVIKTLKERIKNCSIILQYETERSFGFRSLTNEELSSSKITETKELLKSSGADVVIINDYGEKLANVIEFLLKGRKIVGLHKKFVIGNGSVQWTKQLFLDIDNKELNNFKNYIMAGIPILLNLREEIIEPAEIIDQMDYYASFYGINDFILLNTGSYPTNKLNALCEYIKNLKYKVRFAVYLNHNKKISDKTIENLSSAGCHTLFIDINNGMLIKHHVEENIKRIKELFKSTSKNGISLIADISIKGNFNGDKKGRDEIIKSYIRRIREYIDAVGRINITNENLKSEIESVLKEDYIPIITETGELCYKSEDKYRPQKKGKEEKNLMNRSIGYNKEELLVKYGKDFRSVYELEKILSGKNVRPEEITVIEKIRRQGEVKTKEKSLNFLSFKNKTKIKIILEEENIKNLIKGFRDREYEFISHNLDILGIINGKNAFKGPISVELDLSARCNNNCVACWHYSPYIKVNESEEWKNAVLDFEATKRMIDDLKELGTEYVFICGSGEPFLNPHIMEIVSYIRRKGIKCGINTNGTLLNKENLKEMVKLGVSRLHVSLWAATPETYVKTHPSQKETTLLCIRNNLKILEQLKRKFKKREPEVDLVNVILKWNYRELEKMVDFAREVGASRVQFQVVDIVPGKTDFLMLNLNEINWVLSIVPKLKKKAEKYGVELFEIENFVRRLKELKGSYEQKFYDKKIVEAKPCYIGWIYTRISAQGLAYTCSKWDGRYPYGNIYEKRFKEIWFSEKQNKFRNIALFRNASQGYLPIKECYKYCCDVGRNKIIEDKLKAMKASEMVILAIANLYIEDTKDKVFLKKIGSKNFRLCL